MDNVQNTLLIVNDSPYGNERPFNALRLVMSLIKREDTRIKVFLNGDAVACARQGQRTPDGYYNVERMIKYISSRGKVAT